MSETTGQTVAGKGADVTIRRVRAEDLPRIVALDARITGMEKPDYWADIFERYDERRVGQRFFLMAESGDARVPVGYVVGEVRAWEFGSEPCGWVFDISVDPESRQRGIGEALIGEIGACFRAAGIRTMRTMVARQNRLHMAFFRGEGMVAGPYIQLEMDLEEPLPAPAGAAAEKG